MPDSSQAAPQARDPEIPHRPLAKPGNLRRFFITSTLLLMGFSPLLYQLVRFASGSELYSYLILIPFVSGYLVWLRRPLPTPFGQPLSPAWALGFAFAGGGMLASYGLSLTSGSPPLQQDGLALAMYSLVLLFTGICCWSLDRAILRPLAFPLGFLVFLAPLPLNVETSLETFLQHGSSVVAHAFFQIIGTPVFRNGTSFQLPGFSLQVAPECSGIHSTFALFITSLVAGQVLLTANRSRAILALAVLPIALLRNGLRVTVIGELCVHIGPEMIDSYIHRHGGPIFFMLSLMPFSLLLFLLVKTDRPRAQPGRPTP